ncbi:carbamate kinase [Streptococcus hyointestinalis]|uniref:Carbamate kinase n=1 Tax=Streptococcus hyointestinalis TaxID=1337 RepID=A0A380KBW0_9STRE|nr:carbamate kinase [Streptococcus hyointestinalis]SUN62513.1 Carbamate kinase [Streptococcus hyointestinalis]
MSDRKSKVVVALGGNAILSKDASAKAQQEALEQTVKSLVKLIKAGHEVIITHGNGPQVGNLFLQQAASDSEKNPALPLDTLVAMTQGSIGFWMENALNNELLEQGIDKDVATIMTEVIVSADDPAFDNPTKPIGPFLSEEEAKEQMEKTGASFKEDAGRGWRKVVPSPKPIGIKDAKVIQSLVDSGVVVIAAGGGGVPVVQNPVTKKMEGIEAVIDKDFASQTLAELVGADLFIILTGVDNVYINYNQPNQEKLETVTISQLRQYIGENQFAPGSMLPKIEAAIDFVEQGDGRKAIITSLQNLENLDSATQIVKG